MAPIVKFIVGIAGTSLIATAAFKLTRAPLLSGLGSRTAEVMIANGITDGRANWVTAGGWTYRVARLSGTADAATRARTAAEVAALTGIHDALWEDSPATAATSTAAIGGALQGDCIVRLRTSGVIGFGSNDAAINPVSVRAIDSIAQALQQCPAAKVSVIGHTALPGAPAINVALSQARADAVVAALVTRGIAGARLAAIGVGSSMPITTDIGPDADRINSRVEFQFGAIAARDQARNAAARTENGAASARTEIGAASAAGGPQ